MTIHTGAGELRGADRKSVLMRATIISLGGPQTARVRDLTASGARISCDQRLERGSDVIFKRGELFVAARVALGDARRRRPGILPRAAHGNHRRRQRQRLNLVATVD